MKPIKGNNINKFFEGLTKVDSIFWGLLLILLGYVFTILGYTFTNNNLLMEAALVLLLIYTFHKLNTNVIQPHKHGKFVSIENSGLMWRMAVSLGLVIILILINNWVLLKYSGLNSLLGSSHLSSANQLAMMFQTIILAPVMEEVVYRGLIYNFFAIYFNELTGVIVSSFTFGLMHVFIFMLAGNFQIYIWLYLISKILLGLIITDMYRVSNRVSGSVLIHFFNNLVAVVI